MKNQKITQMSFAKVYPLYIAKAERKNRTKEEVDQIITWLTGYDQETLQQMNEELSLKPFLVKPHSSIQRENRSLVSFVGFG